MAFCIRALRTYSYAPCFCPEHGCQGFAVAGRAAAACPRAPRLLPREAPPPLARARPGCFPASRWPPRGAAAAACPHAPLLRAHGASLSSGRRRSPTSVSSAALMRDLLALQRSRSLRDPSTRRSVESAKVAADPNPYTDEDGAGLPGKSRRGAATAKGALKTLLDQLAENPHPKSARRPRRRFKRGTARRAGTTSKAPDRAAAAVSVNSSSQEAVCGNKYLFRDGEELQRHVSQEDSRNVCGIPWNWSRLHHRGKSILDLAGRSLSCGLRGPGI